VAVILADTELIPYGTIDVAVGSSGINPCSIMFGKEDKFGKPKFGGVDLVGLEMTAASALLFGQTDSGIPVAIIRGYEYKFDEKRNVSNTMRFAGNEKDILQIVRGTMKLTSYAIENFGKKLLLRIGSYFVR
jgi:coenzyme F420-0:L-glutamate ligase/coenzyme F420-1:gamma-L-glutamate ligase